MKKILLLCGLATIAAGHAAVLTDDFNRANVGPTTNGALIGSGYVNSSASKDWQIVNNALVFPEPGFVAGGDIVLYNTGITTQTTGALASFSINATVSIDTTNRQGGIAFNLQNSTNFYALRFESGTTKYQFIQNVGGAISAPVNATNATATFALNTVYTVGVSYSAATGNYTFSIKDGSNNVLNPTTSIAASSLSGGFSNGYGGLYVSGINETVTFDNLNIASVPEPSAATLVGAASLLGLTILIRNRRKGLS